MNVQQRRDYYEGLTAHLAEISNSINQSIINRETILEEAAKALGIAAAQLKATRSQKHASTEYFSPQQRPIQSAKSMPKITPEAKDFVTPPMIPPTTPPPKYTDRTPSRTPRITISDYSGDVPFVAENRARTVYTNDPTTAPLYAFFETRVEDYELRSRSIIARLAQLSASDVGTAEAELAAYKMQAQAQLDLAVEGPRDYFPEWPQLDQQDRRRGTAMILQYATAMDERGESDKARHARDVVEAVVEAELNEMFIVQITRWEDNLRELRRRLNN